MPKPDISEEEKSLLHNVTSALYNQPKVRQALDKAVADICRVLHVPVPDKKGKLKKGDKNSETSARKDPEEQPADRIHDPNTKDKKRVKHEPAKMKDKRLSEDDEGSDEEDTEFHGFSDDESVESDESDESDEEVEEKEEKVVSKFNDRLGSSDDDDYDTANEELDPMEITDISASEGSDEDISLGDSGSEEETAEAQDQDEDQDEDEDESDSSAVSPPPKARKVTKKAASTKVKDSHYLPSLMGGYISGSESEASDIDVAPTRKNRRGQRARQAIAEKKFKDKAKHLAKAKAGRDDGWDLKRGAVGGNDRTPWKKGVRTPFEQTHGHRDGSEQEPRRPKPPTKKDNEGPLHASWEAKKKAQEAQEAAKYQGKRVVFD